jgi:WD40 repeat protein
MNRIPKTSETPEPITAEAERCIDRFEEAWQQGRVPVIEDHLPPGGELRAAVLVELVHADLERRLERGEAVQVETYLRRYPELATDSAVVLDLITSEMALRSELGQATSLDDYVNRFPQLSEQLRDCLPQGGQPTVPLARITPAPTSRPLAPESVAIPGYEVLAELGRGGMGVVYRARQTAADRVVAVKMILSGALAGEEERRRFRTEVAAAARLQHPNVVQLFEVGEACGCPFFSLEFVEGGSLAGRLDGTPWDGRQAAALVGCLAEAIHAAHQLGVVHRDLKPANILLTASGQPKISDFGLARKLDEAGQTVTGAVVGTPSYMAPEQASGRTRDVGPAADVYALGAILYELLTGRPPFKGATTLDTLAQVAATDPVPPRQLQPRTPRDLETICLKCLEKAPARRYLTAKALADDLRRFSEVLPILARPASVPEKVVRWARRRPAVALLSLLLLASVSLGFAGVAWQWGQTRAGLQRAEASLYAQRIALADREWLSGRVDRSEQLLSDCPPSRRGWEWRYLRRLCHQEEASFATGSSFAVSFDPQGRHVAVANDQEGTIQIWRLEGREKVATLPSAGPAMAWGPGGTTLASAAWQRGPNGEAVADRPGDILLWDVPGGRVLQRLQGHKGAVLSLAFHPAGKLLASGGMDHTIRIWDLAAGRERQCLSGHRRWVEAVAFDPGGARLASAGTDDTIRLWDWASGDLVRSWGGDGEGTLGRGLVDSTKGSPSARTATSGDDQVKIWNAATAQEVLPWRGQMHQVYCLAFAPDGRTLAAGRGNSIKLWNVATGKELHTLRGHTDQVRGVAFSPDGKRLASAGYDQTVRLWDTATGEEVGIMRGHVGPVNSVAFHNDGDLLASASWDGTARLWAPSRCGEAVVLRGHRDYIRGQAFHPAGGVLATGSADRTIKLWDLAQHRPIGALTGHSGAVNAVAFDPEGKLLASAGYDGGFRLWDVANRTELFVSEPHPDRVFHIGFSPDGRRLATADARGVIELWDVAKRTRERSFPGPGGRVFVTAFQPAGSLLAAAGDDTRIQLLDAATGDVRRTLSGHGGPITHVAFRPDGQQLASSSLDRTIKIWDVAGHQLRTFTGHTNAVTAVAFHPDGTRLASAGLDRTVKVWDLASGEEILSLRGHSVEVLHLEFSPDGRQLAAACVDGTVKVWDATPLPGD